mgnify:CR=1 FL=1
MKNDSTSRALLCVVALCVLPGQDIKQEIDKYVNYSPSYMTVKVTAYCPCPICCGKHSNGKTAINRNAYQPGVAVDKTIIRLRSRLDVPGYGNWVMADDTGSRVKGKHIDVRFNTHSEALEWAKNNPKHIRIRVWTKIND